MADEPLFYRIRTPPGYLVDITKPCRWLMNIPQGIDGGFPTGVDITKPCRWLMNGVPAGVPVSHVGRHYKAMSMADERFQSGLARIRTLVDITKPCRWLMKRASTGK